ncbi:MAG: hypothetical protein AXW12_09585 [Thalassospira sp. Nap_22]|nr:MAG: hypothetical protein AXW12_09585 [Thalassospira sp. Nap_22]
MAEEEQTTETTAAQTSNLVSIPGPPRITGVLDENLRALMEWLLQFYSTFQQIIAQLDPANGLSAADALEKVIDPASATPATAQQTANEAKSIATAANNRSIANRDIIRTFGQFTITGTALTETITFDEKQPNDTYNIVVTAVAFTGTPAFEAFVSFGIAKTTEDFTVSVSVAPGTGNSVTFDWQLRRNDEDE